MAKFLILDSPTKSNIGTVTERENENYFKPSFYKITDIELNEFSFMSAHGKAAFIAEKLELQTNVGQVEKKKVDAVIVESQEESVLDSPETYEEQEDEPINEPINVIKKSKGRPKKSN